METFQQRVKQLEVELAAATQDNATLRTRLEPAPTALLPGLGWRLVDAQGLVLGAEEGSGRRWELVDLSACVSVPFLGPAPDIEAQTLTFHP